MNGNKIKKQNSHLQNAKEIGGTNSTPPLATIKFEAIKIGWINNKEKAKKFVFCLDNLILKKLFLVEKGFVDHHKNCYGH